MTHRIPLAAALATLAMPTTALASAEGPGTPQATAANATFLSNAPAPASGGGICVIDTGVDTDTDLGPALASRVAQIGGVPGDPSDLGAISDTGDTLPKHGTYVAGVIASQVDGVGTSGIWPAAKIYSNRVFGGGSTTTVADYIRAMDWCASQPGMKVVNLSLSGLTGATNQERTTLNDKIGELRGAPYYLNIVAAAGNDGSFTTVGYPALADGVFAVGATDATGRLASFSNRGTGLDITTYGSATCVTTDHGTHLANGVGTSFAAPVVSAVVAALRSYHPSLTPDQAESLLLSHADVVGGVKVLNAAKAFRADANVAALVSSAPETGVNVAAANGCELPPAPSGGSGGGASSDLTDTANPSQPQPVQTVTVAPMPRLAPVMQPPADRPSSAAKPTAPTTRSLTYRRGALTLRISGLNPGDRALYWVTYRVTGDPKTSVTRRFVRMSGTLKVRLPLWTTIRVRIQRPGVGVSKTLVIRSGDEF